MSIHKEIIEAQNRLDDMREQYELGMVDRDMVAQARHELNDLRWVRDIGAAPSASGYSREYRDFVQAVYA